MKRKRIVSMLLVATMAATLFAGCGNDSGKKGGTETGSAKEFDAFFAVPGTEINDDNEKLLAAFKEANMIDNYEESSEKEGYYKITRPKPAAKTLPKELL